MSDKPAFEFIHRGSGLEIRQHARKHGLLDASERQIDDGGEGIELLIDESGAPCVSAGTDYYGPSTYILPVADWAIRWLTDWRAS